MKTEVVDRGGEANAVPAETAIAEPSQACATPKANAGDGRRLASVDALRGFDMFWITGGREILLGAAALVLGAVPAALDDQLRHPDWEGFRAWDMIMPLFLFITGTAMPFSVSDRPKTAGGLLRTWRRIGRRIVVLWILGMMVQGNLIACLCAWDFTRLRLYSNTLQAIAAGYLIASVALLHGSRRAQGLLCAALLAAGWAAFALVPYPGNPAGTLEPMNNIAKYVDAAVLGRFSDTWHYTWVLSSLGFGATVLLGVFSGHLLKSGRPPSAKAGALAAAGACCLAAGWAWSAHFPVIKHIWTGSMVLWSAGWCYLLLAVFYWAIDIRQWRMPAFPFVVVGSNAILAYLAGEFFVENGHAARLFQAVGLDAETARYAGPAVFFGALWCALYGLYRRRLFLRV